MKISTVGWTIFLGLLGCAAPAMELESGGTAAARAVNSDSDNAITVSPRAQASVGISILTAAEVVEQGPDVLVEMRLEEMGQIRHNPSLALAYGQTGKAAVENPGGGESFGITVTRTGDRLEFKARYERNGKVVFEPSAAFGVREIGTVAVEDKAAGRMLTIKVQSVVAATRVTYNFRDKDVKLVIDMISRDSGTKIVVSEEVKGTITASIHNVPWPDALTAIVKTLDCRVVWDEPGTVKILTAEELKKKEK